MGNEPSSALNSPVSGQPGCAGMRMDKDASYWAQVREWYPQNTSIAIANVMEWYEFTSFGFMEAEIAQLFFSGSKTLTWFAFGATFIARPLGGIGLGYVADRWGRRPSLLLSLWGMTVATTLQGFTPTVPYLGPTWMLTCRILQGLATGGEIAALTNYLAESSPQQIKGIASSLVGSGFCLGVASSCAVSLLLRHSLSAGQMLQWGWRIPFIAISIPAIIALYGAHQIEETETFNELQQDGSVVPSFGEDFMSVIQEHWKSGLLCICGMSAMISTSFVGGLYLREWLVEQCQVNGTTASLLLIAVQVASAGVCFATGYMADTVGLVRTNLVHAGLTVCTTIPSLAAMYYYPTSRVALSSLLVVATLINGMSSTIYLWCAGLFPANIRGLALSFYYNLGTCIGGFGPMVCSALTGSNPLVPAYYMAITGLMASTALGTSLVLNKEVEAGTKGGLVVNHLRMVQF